MKDEKKDLPADETKKSIEDGKKMIEMDKALKPDHVDKEKEEEKDAENWRNEG